MSVWPTVVIVKIFKRSYMYCMYTGVWSNYILHWVELSYLYCQISSCVGDSTCGQRALYGMGMTGIPIYNVSSMLLLWWVNTHAICCTEFSSYVQFFTAKCNCIICTYLYKNNLWGPRVKSKVMAKKLGQYNGKNFNNANSVSSKLH